MRSLFVGSFIALMAMGCGSDDLPEEVQGAQSTDAQVIESDAEESVSESEDAAPDRGEDDVPPLALPFPAGELNEVLPGGETICGRGTPFRFFVYVGDPNKVVIDFQGGGACWSELTCGLSGAIFSDTTGDLDEFQSLLDQGFLTGIYDFDNPDNPFRGWTVVHIPYCTGDIHWGDARVDYADDLTIHHRGYRNAMAVFDWIGQYFPGVEHLVSTGCSAGAYGAIGHAPILADMYPDARIAVIADGGSGVITDDFLANSFPNWNAEANMPLQLEGVRGKPIEELTLSDFYIAVANAYPEMRVAQHTTAFDKDQIFYFSVMGGDEDEFNPRLEASLDAITSQADNFRYYLAPGPIHCIHPYDITFTREVEGVAYSDWVRQLVHEDEAPETVRCEDCRDDPLCAACADGSLVSSACGWCDGWVP